MADYYKLVFKAAMKLNWSNTQLNEFLLANRKQPYDIAVKNIRAILNE